MSVFKYFMKTLRACPAHCRVGEGLLARAQRQREGSPRNEDDTRMATADHDRQGQAAHSTNHAL